jgi:hypothetical protein
MRIALPGMSRRENAQAHIFPLQISFQTLEFLQGMMFHASFADIAVGEFIKNHDGVNRIDQIMMSRGLSEQTITQAWKILGKYQSVFESYVFQSVVIGFKSHWDWYIRRLSEFIRFARQHCAGPTLLNQDEKKLQKAGRSPIGEQLSIIELATGISLGLEAAEKRELFEMTLMRNLGLHNRWEIDAHYIKQTDRTGLVEGHLRTIQQPELQKWYSLLTKLVSNTALECAKRFRDAPDFPV